MEKFQWVAAVIAVHPDHTVVGRTRLQKTIKLLQRKGAPLDYDYMLHFYGPYSEGLQADIGLLEFLGLVEENQAQTPNGKPYFVLRAKGPALALGRDTALAPFLDAISTMSKADPVVLELAATYDAFREMGESHETALKRLRQKKGGKCDGGRQNRCLALLKELDLSSAQQA
jgi:uncharacterized protein YwgA